MNTHSFDRNNEKSATSNFASSYKPESCDRLTNRHSRRRSPRQFKDHLPLHPDRRTFPRGRFTLIPSNLPQLTPTSLAVYVIFSRRANNDTQRCWPHQEEIASELGRDVRTVRRAIAELLRLGLIAVLKTRLGNVYTLLDIQPERTEMSSGKEGTKPSENTVVNTPVFSGTSANAPVPRAREGASPEPPAPGSPDEPPLPANPSQPATKPRQRWTGRSHSVVRQLTPVQKAAEQVMAALGIALGLWRTREAIAHAVRQWSSRNPDQGLEAAVAALVDCWRAYLAAPMRFRWGPISFFGENHWQERNSWPVDRRAQQEQRLAREARVGTYDPTGSSGTSEEEWYAANKEMIDYFRNKEVKK